MKLSDALKEMGLTQAEFAAEIQVARSQVSEAVSGAHLPGAKLMKAICEGTGLRTQPNDFYADDIDGLLVVEQADDIAEDVAKDVAA